VAAIEYAGAEIDGCELIQRRQRPRDEAKEEINRQIGEARLDEFPDQATGQDQRLHGPSRHTQNETGAANVGNATFSAPACVGTQAKRPNSGKT